MNKQWLLGLMVAAAPVAAQAEVLVGGIVDVLVDGGNTYSWDKVALPGTQCGNGSQ